MTPWCSSERVVVALKIDRESSVRHLPSESDPARFHAQQVVMQLRVIGT